VLAADGQRVYNDDYLKLFLANRAKSQKSLKKECNESEGYIIWLNFENAESSLTFQQCRPPLLVDLTTTAGAAKDSKFLSYVDVIARISRSMQAEVDKNVTRKSKYITFLIN